MRFRELTPVKFSEIPVNTYFWAEQVDEPARMSDLYKCLKASETEATHRDQGQAFRYEFEADEIVYIKREK